MNAFFSKFKVSSDNLASGSIRKTLLRDKWLYILLLPGILHFILFKYAPMWGILIAFKDFNGYLGFWKSPWVGLTHFRDFFTDPDFAMLFVNTLSLSFLSIIFAFPAPIILSLLLNEIRREKFKRIVQTLVYVPHFLSWVIVVSLTSSLFNSTGVVNGILESMGRDPIQFMTSTATFKYMIVGQVIWKEVGWGTIIFLAAMSGIDMEQYEAAIVDGAGRFKQVWYITLPAIKSTIIIMLILRMGTVLDNGFDQLFLMGNSLNRSVADVFDTYVYMQGITRGAFSYSTAVGLFKSLIGLVLILGSNKIAKKMGESGIL